MADIREVVQQAAPQVDELDLDAVRARARTVRAGDQRRQRLTFGAVAGVLVLIVGLVASPLLRGGGRWGVEEVAVGGQSPLAGLTGPSVLGEGDLSLGDFAGQPLLIHVWAPWCGPCIDSLPDLQIVADEIGGDENGSVQVITIVVESDLERAISTIEETGVDLPTMLLADPDALASALVGSDGTGRPITGTTPPLTSSDPALPSEGPVGAPLVQGLPATIAVNADHEVVGTWLGVALVDELRDMAGLAATATEPAPPATVPGISPTPSSSDFPMPVIPPPSGDEGMHVDPSPNPYPDEGIRTYEVQPGDTLSLIAEAVYGDPTAFGLIAAANDLGGDSTMQVGQILTIPPNPGSNNLPTPPPQATEAAVDPAIEAALHQTAPPGWDPRPTAAGGVAVGNGDEAIRVVEVVVPDGQTAEQLVAEAIAAGEAAAASGTTAAGEVPIELPDGATASFRNPPATHGRLLVPLPGNRLIHITGEGSDAGGLDYQMHVLQPWMADLRAALE